MPKLLFIPRRLNERTAAERAANILRKKVAAKKLFIKRKKQKVILDEKCSQIVDPFPELFYELTDILRSKELIVFTSDCDFSKTRKIHSCRSLFDLIGEDLRLNLSLVQKYQRNYNYGIRNYVLVYNSLFYLIAQFLINNKFKIDLDEYFYVSQTLIDYEYDTITINAG